MLQDYSWTNEGGLRITYRLSSSALKNGVLGLPSAVADFFTEEFRLLNEKGGVIGTIKSSGQNLWGFSGFLRRGGADEGDYMIVTFDLQEGNATIELSSEDMLLCEEEEKIAVS